MFVNNYSRDSLERVFRTYGEERHSGRIADGIVARRQTRPFTTTTELAEAIKNICRDTAEEKTSTLRKGVSRL